MNDTNYKNYKTLKDRLGYTYKGHNLKNLIPGYLNFIFDGINLSSKDVVKYFYDSLRSIDLRKVLETDSPILVSYLIPRTDYRNLAESARKYYREAEVIDLSALPKVKFKAYSFSYIRHFLKSSRLVFTRPVKGDFYTRLALIFIIVKIFNQVKLLESIKHNAKIQKYVCFNSAYKEESLLTEYFNNKEVETITLQHGIFCNFKLFIPFDYINFENLLARKVLCWGQSTVDFLTGKGIDSNRLELIGNLKYKDVKIDKVPQTFNHCLVLLGRGLYVDTNNKLLAVLSEYNSRHNGRIVFYIKKHPFLLDEEHKQFANVSNNIIFLGKEHSVEEILKSSLVDFSIAVNTTAYYESLALGKPCFRWVKAENEDFYGMDDKFETLEELEGKIESFKEAQQTELSHEMQSVIRYIFNPNL